MNTEKCIYGALEKVTGLSEKDFLDYQDTNLMESGILDSMGIVSLVNEISRITGKKIAITQLSINDFTTIETLISALDKLLSIN